MNHTEIRVVTGPANYFSHAGSLERLTDFFYAGTAFPRRLGVRRTRDCRRPALPAGSV